MRLLAAALGSAVLAVTGLTTQTPPSAQSPTASVSRGETKLTLLAAGDIACDPTSPYFGSPGQCQQNAVGHRVRRLVDNGADWFLPLGDVQYEKGGYSAFADVYGQAFQGLRGVTKPVTGNHEYITSDARGYFRYFGKHAGRPNRPWRAFRPLAGWRVLLLDSNCEYVGGCGRQSEQGRWIRRTLADTNASCVLATWHHPLRTSGEYAGNDDSQSRARKLWKQVVAGGADVVLNGHDHIYERFAKRRDTQQFVVGTGGKNHYDITTKAPGSRKRINDRYGVLRLVLHRGSYRSAFVGANGGVVDRNQTRCTNEPSR